MKEHDGSAGDPAPPDQSPAEAPSDFDPAILRERIARSVSRVCPSWMAPYKDDIVQAAVMRVLQSRRGSEHNPVPPASYIWKVAYSATVDQIRRIRRTREVPMDDTDVEEIAPARRTDPLQHQSVREMGRAINECLKGLSERRRLTVGFHLFGHDLAECERLTGWGPKRVRNLLYRGLADLRACLSMKGYEP